MLHMRSLLLVLVFTNLLGCTNNRSAPTDPQNSEQLAVRSTGQEAPAQSYLLTVVDTPRSDLSDIQKNRLAILESREYVAEVHIARLGDVSNLRAGLAQQIGMRISSTEWYAGVVNRTTNHESESVSWSGPLADGWGRFRITVSADNKNAFGEIVVNSDVEGIFRYGIQPLGDGLQAISLLNEAGFPEDIVVLGG